MSYILIDDAKKHCNIDEDFHDDDEYIKLLIDVAEDAVSKHIDKPLDKCLKHGKIEASIRACILLMIGQLYANREPVSYATAVEVPLAYNYLANLNKTYVIP